MANVSVVIVNYNSGRFLEVCVNSVCRSDCSLEIIVVDNASTDNSAHFLSSFRNSKGSLRVIRNEENQGFGAGVNRGVRHSNSENILLLNPDCLVFSHTIRSLSEALDSDPSVGIVGGLVFNVDGSEQRGCRRREPTLVRSLGKVFRRQMSFLDRDHVDMNDEPLPKKRIYVDAVSGSFLMIRQTVLNEIGGMDEHFFLHFEDFDLCRRVRDFGRKVMFIPDISIFHFQGGSSDYSAHRVSWEKHRSMLRYQRKHYGNNPWLQGLIFSMVWVHFLLQRMRWMFTHRSKFLEEQQWSSRGWPELLSPTCATDAEKGKRLLVLGVVDKPVRDMIRFGVASGWLVYVGNHAKGNQRMADVHWLHAEYFDKVPVRDAPMFNALLIAPSLSWHGEVSQIVEKFQVGRVAILQPIESTDKLKEDDATKLADAEFVQGASTSNFIGGRVLYGETKLFRFSPSETEKEDHLDGAQGAKTAHDCFVWLSK